MTKDIYPDQLTIPADALVAPAAQPEYLDGTDGAGNTNIADAILLPRIGRDAGRLAIIHHETGSQITYGELDALVSRLASALANLGLQPGDRVAFRSANRTEGIIAALATWQAGGIVVPIPMQARATELRFYIEDTGVRFLISQGDPDSLAAISDGLAGGGPEHVVIFAGERPDGSLSWDELLAEGDPDWEGVSVSPDAVAIVWHTGGTTGVPKACYHTHRRFLLAGDSLGKATRIEPGERWAAAAPIGHALGFIYHTNYTLLHGATIVLIEEFHRPETLLSAIAEREVGTFTAIAATWGRMREVLERDPDRPFPGHLRRAFAMWQSASSSSVYGWWQERGVELLNNFGSTAFATWVLVPDARKPVEPGSLGLPAPGYEVIAVDPEAERIVPVPAGTPGRMAVRGPSGLTYWRRPDLQERDVRDGWTLHDDLIEFDGTGNARYLGRTDFLISTAGYKVASVEVEQALGGHPCVKEVAVMGLPDALRREIVAAFVVVSEGVEPSAELTLELQDLVKRELAPYKYPRRVEYIDELPRDSVGKVQQRLLKERFEREIPA